MAAFEIPEIKPLSIVKLPEIVTESLANGVTLHLLDSGELPATKFTFVWSSGPREAVSPAAAALMPEALREGCKQFTGAEMSDIFDFNGVELSCRAANHFTSMEFTALNSRIDPLRDVIIGMLTEPSVPHGSLDAIKASAAAGMRMRRKQVAWLAAMASKPMVYGANHPDVKEITPEETEAVDRDEVLESYRRIIGSRGCNAYIAGRITPDVRRCIDAILSALPSDNTPDLDLQPYRPEPPRRVDVTKPDAVQSAVVITLPAIPRQHSDYIALHHTVNAFGGYFGSRLMTNIREDKGYTYHINAGLMGTLEGSNIEITAQCHPSYVEAVVAETFSEMRRMVSNPPSGDELERLRLNIMAGCMTTLDTPFESINYEITRQLVGIPEGYFERRQRLALEMGPRDYAGIAEKYLRPELASVTVAGPEKV